MAGWRDRLNGTSLYWLSQITRKSGRFQVSGLNNLKQAQESGRPLIFATWHGFTMMLVAFFADHYDVSRIVLLMPDDWRGAALEIFARKVGAEPYPMDLTGEGGMASARKLTHLIRRVREGFDCYITPDGPDGPAYVIKPGITYIARKAKALIVPLGAYARHAYRLPRWDRYVVPLPFSRISVTIGEPIETPDKGKETAVTEHLTNVLHRMAAQAAANYYEQPGVTN